jgi:hypothetical protein
MPRIQVYVTEAMLRGAKLETERLGLSSVTEFARYALSRAIITGKKRARALEAKRPEPVRTGDTTDALDKMIREL